jgi:glycine hydroxymethyltransferase
MFPGAQGGPLVHVIAAKAVCFKQAMSGEFKTYAKQIVVNAQALSETLDREGFRLVSGGTDNHLILVDVGAMGVTGKEAEEALEKAGITVNKNTIPFDERPPFVASGIRIATPALTTRGMEEEEMRRIGGWIAEAIRKRDDESALRKIAREARDLSMSFPSVPRRLNPASAQATVASG